MFSARLTIQIKSNLRPVTTVTVVAGYHLENIKNMKREDKELLFKDLSARLPYHVRCKIWLKDRTTEEGPLDLEHNYGDVLQHAFYYNDIKEIKPYLRPMSSVSELISAKEWSSLGGIELIDWYNANHIDYRGLIPKGLAIEASKDMYNEIKEEKK